MRYLWVLRHGKAVSESPGGGNDKERPLADRGRRDATACGYRLAAGRGAFGLGDVPTPVAAICSAAARTRETAEAVASAMGGRLPVQLFHSLYGSDTDTAMRYLLEIDDSAESALIVGHNPTMYQLAWELLSPAEVEAEAEDGAGASAGDDRSVLRSHGLPTCALAVLRLHVTSWRSVAAGCGSLAGVFIPPY
ncbi:MAG: SixA phosphatase family protein [Acidimicrobiales bacterium]